ncbi:MAG TPA: hypothetical protein VNU46_05825, partial [Gemmatimonadaceae bacterium]|nr:hypothetical protein [Gemmatimonadaceae bacterium]
NHLVHRLQSELLHPMRRIAKLSGIASDTEVSFIVPRPRTAIATIIECARIYAAAAEPHRETFVELGMDPDFIEQLRTLVDALATEASTASSSRTRGTQNAHDFRAQLKEARRLAWLLDSIIRRYCAHVLNTQTPSTDPKRLANIKSALSGWTTSFHIERDPVRRARRLRPTL